MTKRVLMGAISLVAASGAGADLLDARQMGRGFTALNGSYLDAGSNPALTNRHDESDDFGVNLNVGALVSDKHELIDSVDGVSEDLDELEEAIENDVATQADVDSIVGSLQDLDRKAMAAQIGLSLNLGIPNRHASATLVAGSHVRLGGSLFYDDRDATYLSDAVSTGNSELDGLESQVVVNAVAVTSVGVALGRTFDVPKVGAVAFGATPKLQRIDLFDYAASAKNFEEDDIDADEFATDKTAFNLDLGAFKAFDNGFRAAAHIENLIPVSVDSARGDAYEQRPVVVAGGGWANGWVAVDSSVDLTAREGFGVIGDTQYLRLGAELDAWRWAQLRVGFRHDVKGTDEDVITAGIGLSPFNVINLDIGAAYGSNDTYGAALQLGVRL
ncbi:MAG: hypothetical protein CL583_04815 [Alteromonadaceae bacterium]|nr:hypothetical protein [Alteromonadaceae bacterium]